MQDAKAKRLLIVCSILVFICLVCLFVTIRYIDKYRNNVAQTTGLQEEVELLEQALKDLDMRTRELEARRYALSLEKGQINKEYSTVKDKYASLEMTLKVLERDVNIFKGVVKDNEAVGAVSDEDVEDAESLISALQSQNDMLLKELANKTKEKMILKIALEAQAKRLGLAEGYNPDLKETVKRLVTSLQ